MPAQHDVKFVRIKGRVVPIKRKKNSLDANPKKGAVKITIGSLLGIGGAASGAKSLKKSFADFRSSAGLVGLSRISPKGSKIRSNLLRSAAKLKLSGIKHSKISKGKFGFALGVSSIIVGSGVTDFFRKDDNIGDEVGGVAGTAASALIVGATARKLGIRAKNINQLFAGFSSRGRFLSRKKINRITKTKFDPKRTKRGSQGEFDL